MAIKGISDRRRLPRQGKIKIGEKRTKMKDGKPVMRNGKLVEYPVALDYFKVPEEIAGKIAEVYGEKPRSLDIMFLVNDPEQIFPQHMKKYGLSTGLLCKGDGETGATMVNGELVERMCDPDDEFCKGCSPKGTLNYSLTKFPGLGVWQTTTSGWNSIVNINTTIDMIAGMTGGRISFIPLKLKLMPHEGVVHKDGAQFKKTVYTLTLDIDESMEEFYARFSRKQIAPSEQVLQIQAAGQDFIDRLNESKAQRESELQQSEEEDPDEQLDNIHSIYATGMAKGLNEDEIIVLVWLGCGKRTDQLEDLTEKEVAVIVAGINKNTPDGLREVIANIEVDYDEWLAFDTSTAISTGTVNTNQSTGQAPYQIRNPEAQSTVPQQQKIHVTATKKKIDDKTLKGYLKIRYGTESTKGLNRGQASEFIKYLSSATKEDLESELASYSTDDFIDDIAAGMADARMIGNQVDFSEDDIPF